MQLLSQDLDFNIVFKYLLLACTVLLPQFMSQTIGIRSIVDKAFD